MLWRFLERQTLYLPQQLKLTVNIVLNPTQFDVGLTLVMVLEHYENCMSCWNYLKYPLLTFVALAIEAVKSSMNLGEWSGDPCLPTPHSWLTCEQVSSPYILTV